MNGSRIMTSLWKTARYPLILPSLPPSTPMFNISGCLCSKDATGSLARRFFLQFLWMTTMMTMVMMISKDGDNGDGDLKDGDNGDFKG